MFIGSAIVLGVLVFVFIAYFITSFDSQAQQWYDGFGRSLDASPWFMRLVFGQDRLWAGWYWFFVDMIIFWGGMVVGTVLFNLGDRNTTG